MKTMLKVAASVGIAVLVILAIIGFTFFCMANQFIGAIILITITGIGLLLGISAVVYMVFFEDM